MGAVIGTVLPGVCPGVVGTPPSPLTVGRTAMPTMGLVRAPVGWPRSVASPKVAREPSAPTAQYPAPDEVVAIAATDRTRVVVVCTPNNPTGTAVSDAELRDLVDRVPARVLVVVDEAYREFVRDDDPVDALALAAEHANVAVMRTFAKAYGLAGLRVGYLVAPEVIAKAVRACALPFGVSAVAQAAAVAALRLEDRLLEQVDAIVAERERVRDALRGQGWPVPPTQANFVWLRLGDRTAAFAAAAEAAGVIVRPFSGEGVRVTIGEPAANDLFVGVAASFAPA